jgi:hypothetical protein
MSNARRIRFARAQCRQGGAAVGSSFAPGDAGATGAVGDHPRAPARLRREDAVVEHEIDPWPLGERRESLEQRE